MHSMVEVFLRIPLFKLYRRLGWPRMLPLNLTLSPSPKCNSRCLTCNIWMKREDELTLEEWNKVLASLGRAPYWFTISGGEPLMYPHVVELIQSAESMLDLCKEDSLGGTEIRSVPSSATLPEGAAVLESPQGLLYHRYKVDNKGLVEDIEVLDAALLNNLFYCLVAQKAAENAIARGETKLGVKSAIELALLSF